MTALIGLEIFVAFRNSSSQLLFPENGLFWINERAYEGSTFRGCSVCFRGLLFLFAYYASGAINGAHIDRESVVKLLAKYYWSYTSEGVLFIYFDHRNTLFADFRWLFGASEP